MRKLALFYAINILVSTVLAQPEPQLIVRPHHGIVFEKLGILDNDMTSWYQTFIIPLPKVNLHDDTTDIGIIKQFYQNDKPLNVDPFDRNAPGSTPDVRFNTLMIDYKQ
jgi:hypothetical protein